MDDAVDDDADDEDEDDHRSLDEEPASKSARQRPMDAPQESDYDFIYRDNKLIMVATNSDEYKSSAIGSDIDTNNFDLQNASTTQVTNLIEAMTDGEWEKYVQSYPEDLLDFLTTAPCTTTCSDVELNDDESPVKIDFRCQSDVFVAQTVNLITCNAAETGNLFFCVDRLSVTDSGLVFCLQEPCLSRRRCKHVTLEGLEGESIRSPLPCKIPLVSIDYDESLTFKSEDVGKPGSYILSSFRRCHGRKQCLHTLVENKHPSQIKCAFPVKFHASFGEHASDMSESDTGTERVPSAAGNGSGDQVEHAGSSSDKQTQKCDPEFPLYPSLEDDEHAFSILKDVVLKRSSSIPGRVTFDTLFHFLRLVHKYNLGDVPLKQAKTWIQFLRFQIPKYFSKETATWLWILWKLQMKPEFKELSGIVQQQARRPIDQEENWFHAPLPKYIIDLIEERRLSILSRIKSTVISEINSNREYYLEAFTDAINRPYFATPARIMRASSVVGYLTLESERWLRPNSEEDSILEFDGVCFLDVCRGVRSMLGPGDLMSEIMPRPSPGGFIFPLILNFVGLDRVHISEGLPANYKNRLVDLITNLEKEDWGIDLAKVTRY